MTKTNIAIADYISAIKNAAISLDKANVPQDGRYIAVTPETFNSFLNADKENASTQDKILPHILGFGIFSDSNLSMNQTAIAGENAKYAVNEPNVQMLVFHKDAVEVAPPIQQVKASNDSKAVFLKTIATEINDHFDANVKLIPRVDFTIISDGKSLSFANGDFGSHKPGIGLSNRVSTTHEVNVGSSIFAEILINDIKEIEGSYDRRQKYAKKLGENLARAYDNHILSCLASSADSRNTHISQVDLLIAQAAIEMNLDGTPLNNRYFVIPLKFLTLSLMDDYLNGRKVYGFEIVPVISESDKVVFYHKDALAVIQLSEIMVRTDFDPRRLGESITAKKMIGVGSINSKAILAYKLQS